MNGFDLQQALISGMETAFQNRSVEDYVLAKMQTLRHLESCPLVAQTYIGVV